jgi:hypothetical protein
MVARVRRDAKKNARQLRLTDGRSAPVINASTGQPDKPAHIGRPSKYRPEFARQAEALTRLGAIDKDLADYFRVSITTIGQWQTTVPEFLSALKGGKEAFDERVERSLAIRALGYSYDSEKLFYNADINKVVRAKTVTHVPPDVTACIFWLKNRKPDDWRDVHRHDHRGGIIHLHVTEDEAKY